MLNFWTLFSSQNIIAAIVLFILSLFGLGCSQPNPDLTDEQNRIVAERQAEWFDRIAKVADKHGLAYRVTARHDGVIGGYIVNGIEGRSGTVLEFEAHGNAKGGESNE